MRDASIAVLREIGVDTGGSNVQFAINPDGRPHGRHRDEPARVALARRWRRRRPASRSPRSPPSSRSATRSTSCSNDITGGATPASFEPTIDYVVTKIPRFAFEKFPQADDRLTTQMKSVGEVMAIGRTFQESLQKALRGLEIGVDGFNLKTVDPRERSTTSSAYPRAERLWYVADAFGIGMTLEEMHALTKIDPWFLAQIKEIVDTRAGARRSARSTTLDATSCAS